MIEINGLSFSFGSDFSLNIDSLVFTEGRISVIIGPNGSGKSTLMSIMAGFNRQFTGAVDLCGRNLRETGSCDTAKLVSYVGPRPDALPDMKVMDVVATGRYPYVGGLGILDEKSVEMVDNALEKTGLTGKKHRRVSSLSSGEAQRVMIARSIAQDTPVILMDEAISNLDPGYTFEIINILKNLKKNKTIVMVLHDLNTALNISDRLVGLKKGRVGFVLEEMKDVTAELMSELFDVGFEMHRFDDKSFISFK